MASADTKNTDMNALRSAFGQTLERRKQTEGVTTSTANHGNKSKNLADPQAGKIPSFAGDYDLLKLTLTSPNRKNKGYVDLRNAFSDLNIYEDVFASCLTGNITLTDGTILVDKVPE